MPFDTMTTAAIADEVRAFAVGGRLQRIIQPSDASVAVSIYSRGAQHWLLLSADARYARVHLSGERLAKAFATPSPFIMLLRKYLEGAHVVEVGQLPHERVLILTCRGGQHETRLMAEVMGKHSNIVLVDEHDMVLGAIKTVRARQSRVRTVLPGQRYSPPPAQERNATLYGAGERIDPHEDPREFERLFCAVPPDTSLRAALLGLLSGAGPFLVDQIVRAAGLDPSAPTGQVDAERVWSAARDKYALYGTRVWRPCTFEDGRGHRDFAPYVPLGFSDVQAGRSLSEAVEECWGGEESRDVLRSARNALLADIEREMRAVERKIGSLREGLDASADAERVMYEGQLILAYGHSLDPGARELSIPELDTMVALDPALSAKENAERFFRRYRKLRDAQRRIPALLQEAEARAETLHDLLGFARFAGSERELRELRKELRPEAGGEPRKHVKPDPQGGPLRFSLNGYRAMVGRNARENDDVTFHLARRDDLWLHVRGRTGAHVVIQGGGQRPPDDVVEAAARLAAYFSEGRWDSRVDVDATPVRNVRKIPGGAPGRVTYRDFRTLHVEPGMDPWQQAVR